MFYIKEDINDTLNIKINIKKENTYTKCIKCEKEIAVDLSRLLACTDNDLEETSVLCEKCSSCILEEMENK